MMVKASATKPLNMIVESAFKIVISGGTLVPDETLG
jgi:uncharacterized membrane protein